jgi:hypothetical protein
MFSLKSSLKTLLGISALCLCLSSVSAVSAQSGSSGSLCAIVVQTRAMSIDALFNPKNGDVNADGARTLTDVILILQAVIYGTAQIKEVTCWLNPSRSSGDCQNMSSNDFEAYGIHPVTQEEVALSNGDVNADGQVDMSDAIYLAGWLMNGTADPVEFAGARLKTD